MLEEPQLAGCPDTDTVTSSPQPLWSRLQSKVLCTDHNGETAPDGGPGSLHGGCWGYVSCINREVIPHQMCSPFLIFQQLQLLLLNHRPLGSSSWRGNATILLSATPLSGYAPLGPWPPRHGHISLEPNPVSPPHHPFQN